MAKQDYLRWGLVGIGSGASNLLDGFKNNPHARVTAAADVRREALEAFGREFDCRIYLSAEELCKDPDVDAVWVATPNHLHAEHVITAAQHGKHVTVSKPMAITLQDCEAMNQAAEKNGVVLLCGHTQSMLAPVRKMAELVRSGEYGRLGMVNSWHYNDWIYRPRMPYELDVSQGGGAVFRQSPHHIDIVRLIGGGMVKSVRGKPLQIDPSRPAPGGFVVYLEFADGVPCTLVYSGYGHFDSTELTFGRAYSPGRVSATTTAEEEAAMKEARRYTAGQGSGNSRPEPEEGGHRAFGLTIATCERADIRQSPRGLWVYDDQGKHEIPVPKQQSRGEEEFEEMYRAVVNGEHVIHDGRWGEATHEVTLAIMESAQTGKEIAMSHQVGIPS
jgi:phthalate 4,5-cis-dihydrodiol dehydrogenase